MEGETSLDDLLSGAEPVVAEAAPEPVIEAAEPEPEQSGQPRDQHGRFAPKEEKGVDTPPVAAEPSAEPGPPPEQAGLPRDVYEPLKAVRNENRELKQQIEALNQRFAALPQTPAQEQPVDFWDNPEAFMAKQLEHATALAVERIQQQQTMERINASEAAAKGRYADYEDAFRAFQQAATANPTLIQQMTAAGDPAEFAYKKGKTALQLEQVGSIDELLKNERAKWEAEARAAMPQPSVSLPSTTATDGSVGARTGPAWSGPTPLGDMLA